MRGGGGERIASWNTGIRGRAGWREGEEKRMKLKWNYPKEQTRPRGFPNPGERLKRDRMDAKESFTLLPHHPALSNYALVEMGERAAEEGGDTDFRASERFPPRGWVDVFLGRGELQYNVKKTGAFRKAYEGPS